MKNYQRFVLVVVAILFVGCAGSSKYMTKATPMESPPSGKALVYFMRPSGLGFAINFQIWDGERFIGLSQAKSYFAYPCDPGKHLFIGMAENKRGIEADLVAGKSYYVITQVKMGAWRARMGFIPVNQDSEFWDVVEGYKNTLNFISPKEDMLAVWENKKQNEVLEVISYLNTSEGRNYVVLLNRDAGR